MNAYYGHTWRNIVYLQNDLAEGQGGSDVDNAGHIDTPNIFAKISQMGNCTITSKDQMAELASSLQVITQTVNELKRDMTSLKNARSTEDSESEERQVKRAKTGESHSYDTSSSENEPGDEIDIFMARSQSEVPEGNVSDWADIVDYFEDEQEVGDDIPAEIAQLANSVLRSKPREEKVKIMKNKHKRPKNVENLQVPKINEQLWHQLKRDTKLYDYAMQKSQQTLCHALVPTLRLMQNVKQNGATSDTTELVTDIFKILAQGVVQSNDSREKKSRKIFFLPIGQSVTRHLLLHDFLAINFKRKLKTYGRTKPI